VLHYCPTKIPSSTQKLLENRVCPGFPDQFARNKFLMFGRKRKCIPYIKYIPVRILRRRIDISRYVAFHPLSDAILEVCSDKASRESRLSALDITISEAIVINRTLAQFLVLNKNAQASIIRAPTIPFIIEPLVSMKIPPIK
jgi:uncharacterized protein (DUF4213/DUF364 family)